MRNLLSAGLLRMWKSRLFQVLEVISAGYGLYIAFELYFDHGVNGYIHVLDDGLFNYVILEGILAAVFCSLFIGTEYSDGTIRNKIIVGHDRRSVYLSKLISCCTAITVFAVTYLICYLVPGGILLGSFQEDVGLAILVFLGSIVLGWAYAAIYTLFSMLNQNKAVVAVVSILLAFIFLFAGVTIRLKLGEPATFDANYYETEDGEIEKTEGRENPSYLEGAERTFYQFLNDFLPGGQSVELSGMTEQMHFSWKYPIYSFGIIILTSGCGLVLFRKKDLK